MGFYLDPSTLVDLPPGELMWGVPWEMIVEQQAQSRRIMATMDRPVQSADEPVVNDPTPVQEATEMAMNDPTPRTPTNISSPMFHATPPTIRAAKTDSQERIDYVLPLPRASERSHESWIHENYGNILERQPTPPLQFSFLNRPPPSSVFNTARLSSVRIFPPTSWDPSLKLPPIISHLTPLTESHDAGSTSEYGEEVQVKQEKEDSEDGYPPSPESDYVGGTFSYGGEGRPETRDRESEAAQPQIPERDHGARRIRRAWGVRRHQRMMMALNARDELSLSRESNYVICGSSSGTTWDCGESRKRKRAQESDNDNEDDTQESDDDDIFSDANRRKVPRTAIQHLYAGSIVAREEYRPPTTTTTTTTTDTDTTDTTTTDSRAQDPDYDGTKSYYYRKERQRI